MPQVYLELNEVGILHRMHDTYPPRWRRDDVYKLIVGPHGPIAYETP